MNDHIEVTACPTCGALAQHIEGSPPTWRKVDLPAAGNIEVLRGLVAFLNGEAPLDGCWFGEDPPPGEGRYWWRKQLTAALAALSAQADGCHCATCTCTPGMTPAVRFDTSPAERDSAVRDHLIRMGWTPPDAQAEAKRDREADRARFPDPDFNNWLDEGISDCGHIVWHQIGDLADAWAGWEARQYYGRTEFPRDDELPGMWSASDFTGSDPDERSYAKRNAKPEAQAGVAEAIPADSVDGELSVEQAINELCEMHPGADRLAMKLLAALFTHKSVIRYRADTTPPPGAVLDGWRLVPVEPTPAMLEAGWGICGGKGFFKKFYSSQPNPARMRDANQRYFALIAAAPAKNKEK